MTKRKLKNKKCEYGCWGSLASGFGYINQKCPRHHMKFVGAPIIKDEQPSGKLYSVPDVWPQPTKK